MAYVMQLAFEQYLLPCPPFDVGCGFAECSSNCYLCSVHDSSCLRVRETNKIDRHSDEATSDEMTMSDGGEVHVRCIYLSYVSVILWVFIAQKRFFR